MFDLKKLVGLNEADAVAAIIKAKFYAVIISRDGKWVATTCDYRTNRVNLSIEKGIVITASIG